MLINYSKVQDIKTLLENGLFEIVNYQGIYLGKDNIPLQNSSEILMVVAFQKS